MSRAAKAEACDSCGAPLELDIDGRCRWCHAHIEVKKDAPSRYTVPDSDSLLVPDDADDCFTASAFLYLLLATLGPGLSYEPAVQAYLRDQPVFHHTVRALGAAVSEAGARARDSGRVKSSYDYNFKAYAPEEVWMFDLAVDLIAMLGRLDGTSKKTQASIAGNLQLLDKEVVSHVWKKQLKNAGQGPERFRELRAKVPHHTPHPGQNS